MIEYNEALTNDLITDQTDKLSKISRYFLEIGKPRIFHPFSKDNYIKLNDRHFEETCFFLEEKGVSNPGKLSLYSFIARIKKIEEQIEEKKAKG